MDPLVARTTLPRFWKGVRKSWRSSEQKFLPTVFDTETCYAQVFATGFFDGKKLRTCYGHKRDHLRWWLDQLRQLPLGHGTGIAASHFLIFDLGVLFFKILNPFGSRLPWAAPKRSYFSLLEPKCTVEIFWGRPCFGSIRFGKKTVHLVDTFAFFGMSLARALKAIGSKHRKLKKPERLGKRLIPLSEVYPYLAGDLKGDFALLEDILARHREFGISLCISAPMMAGKIFRRHYMTKDFKAPGKALMDAALLSYHGGKNSFVAKPGWYKNAWDLDINSAYAEAMAQLPDFSNGRWQRGNGNNFVARHPHGIYRVRGEYFPCKWGSLFRHDFTRLQAGRFSNLWVTGYELTEAQRSGEINVKEVTGWGWRPNKRPSESPFKAYVKHWYTIKAETKNKPLREFAKHMLTDIYGKFIARVEDEENPGEYIAGGMFDPAIASLITGFVRAKIHSLEHRYNALHTATDGFITQVKPRPSDCGVSLGELKQETFGPVLILRNKLYLHYDETGKLRKTGLHGFELGPEKLLRLWKSAKRMYRVERLVRWSEAWHIGLPPGYPRTVKKELHLAGVGEYE